MINTIIEKLRFKKDPIDYCRKMGVKIGNDCQIMGTKFPFGTEPYLVEIGDRVRINSGVQFITHDGSVWVLRGIGNAAFGPLNDTDENLTDVDIFGRIEVGNNVQIGSNAMILPGVKIGSNVIIGAGAIVTKDIPDDSVAVGIPAKVIENIAEYYRKNKKYVVHTKKLTGQEKKEFLSSDQSLGKIK